MSNLEDEIVALRKQIADLAERVRLDAVAKEFLAKEVVYREGDVFRDLNDNLGPSKIYEIRQPHEIGKSYVRWGISGGHHSYEAPAPDPATIERFYTHAEVAEIVAKATRAIQETTITAMTGALREATNPEYVLRRVREALGLP